MKLSVRLIGIGIILSLGLGGLSVSGATAASDTIVSGCNDHALSANDDDSSSELPLPFPLKFGGSTFSKAWVNNNGNITFDRAEPTYTPYGLEGTQRAIIAPFFADVDTRNSSTVTYSWGTSTFEGRQAVCVNWVDVGLLRTAQRQDQRFSVGPGEPG